MVIYVWAKPDCDYTKKHDVYQESLEKDFSGPPGNSFAGSFRSLGNARKDTIRYCCNPNCALNKDKKLARPCFVRERLTTAKHVARLPRWQIIQCRVDVNPKLPNNHRANMDQFRKLKVKPYPTLDLHGFFERPALGSYVSRHERPHFKKEFQKKYKLRGYVLLSSKTYSKYNTFVSYKCPCPIG